MEQPCVTARSFANIISHYSKQQDSEKNTMRGLTYVLSLLCHSFSLRTTTVTNNKREGGCRLVNGTGYCQAGPPGARLKVQAAVKRAAGTCSQAEALATLPHQGARTRNDIYHALHR